jgi:hypothetical protein
MMRLKFLAPAMLAAACATAGGALPTPRYADAASRGAISSFFAGRPSAEQVRQTTDNWTQALGDSVACGVSAPDVLNAGLVGALEIGAMNAAMSQGGEREIREGARNYLGQLIGLVSQRRDRPPRQRCAQLEGWAPRVAAQGRDAVERARRNGLIEGEYGMLLDLTSH